MRFPRFLLGGVLLLGAQAASAQFSSTLTLVSDYDFRGFSQTAKDPALQASADYAFGESGFAIGAWGSNVDFDNDADIELDLYGSYTHSIGETSGWTAGFVYYAYPGSDDVGEFVELYAGLNLGPVSVKQWYTDNLYDLDEDAFYTEANATFELPRSFSLILHAGYAFGDAWDSAGDEVLDYGLGVGYAAKNFNLSLKLVGTDSDIQITDDVNNNEDRVVFSAATTLPWGN